MHVTTCSLSMKDAPRFVENHALGSGGALLLVNPIDLNIDSAILSSNVVKLGNGGAVSMTAADEKTRFFRGCRFVDNEVVAGGAMHLYTSVGNETVAGSTFSGNYAGMDCPYFHPLFVFCCCQIE